MWRRHELKLAASGWTYLESGRRCEWKINLLGEKNNPHRAHLIHLARDELYLKAISFFRPKYNRCLALWDPFSRLLLNSTRLISMCINLGQKPVVKVRYGIAKNIDIS